MCVWMTTEINVFVFKSHTVYVCTVCLSFCCKYVEKSCFVRDCGSYSPSPSAEVRSHSCSAAVPVSPHTGAILCFSANAVRLCTCVCVWLNVAEGDS